MGTAPQIPRGWLIPANPQEGADEILWEYQLSRSNRTFVAYKKGVHVHFGMTSSDKNRIEEQLRWSRLNEAATHALQLCIGEAKEDEAQTFFAQVEEKRANLENETVEAAETWRLELLRFLLCLLPDTWRYYPPPFSREARSVAHS